MDKNSFRINHGKGGGARDLVREHKPTKETRLINDFDANRGRACGDDRVQKYSRKGRIFSKGRDLDRNSECRVDERRVAFVGSEGARLGSDGDRPPRNQQQRTELGRRENRGMDDGHSF